MPPRLCFFKKQIKLFNAVVTYVKAVLAGDKFNAETFEQIPLDRHILREWALIVALLDPASFCRDAPRFLLVFQLPLRAPCNSLSCTGSLFGSANGVILSVITASPAPEST